MNDINQKIETLLNDHSIVLFMKGSPDFPQCGFSAQTVGALRDVNATFHAVNILEDQDLREGLKVYANWPTYPQVYVKGELIGGCDIVLNLHQTGELKTLVA